MSDLNEPSSDVGCASAHHAPEQGAPKHTLPKRLALCAIELLLVAIILGLLIATWLPALIGGNPAAPHGPALP